MADGLIDTPVINTFRLASGTTGETFTISAASMPDGTNWAGPTITEVGSGTYTCAFTPHFSGIWTTTITGDTSGEVFIGSWEILDSLVTSLLHTEPVTDNMQIYQGDDYQSAEGRQYQWSLDNIVDLTGATVTLTLTAHSGPITATGSVINPGASTQTIVVELTAEQTAQLRTQGGRYDLSAVLANGHEVTLARGWTTVTEDFS